jgi:hypothetical protein
MTAPENRPPPLPLFDPAAVMRWGQRLTQELVRLPDSIAQWREGVALFLDAARRMDAVTTAAEDLFAQIEASGVPEQIERLNRMWLDVSRTMASGGATVGEQVIEEARRSVTELGRLFGEQLRARSQDE